MWEREVDEAWAAEVERRIASVEAGTPLEIQVIAIAHQRRKPGYWSA